MPFEKGLRPTAPRNAEWGERSFEVSDPQGVVISFAEVLWSSDAWGPSHRRSVGGQEDDRADDRHDEPHRIAIPVPADQPAQKATDERSHDSEKHRDEEAARITPRHQELGHDPDGQTEEYPSNDVHRALPFKRSVRS